MMYRAKSAQTIEAFVYGVDPEPAWFTRKVEDGFIVKDAESFHGRFDTLVGLVGDYVYREPVKGICAASKEDFHNRFISDAAIVLNLRDPKVDPPKGNEEVLAFYIHDGDCFLAISGKKQTSGSLYAPMSEVQKEIARCGVRT